VDAIVALAAAGVAEIDTSRVYRQGKAEEWHGEALRALPAATAAALTVSSKAHPMLGGLGPAALKQQAADTMAQLGVPQLDIYYLHNVDTATPIEETLKAVDELHQAGVFRRFGLSNYPAWQVVQIHSLCQLLGYITPSVYQGLYNAFSRTVEYELLPALRSLGMAFFAYSPLAGGLLAGSTSAARSGYRDGMLADLGVSTPERRAAFEEGMASVQAAATAAGLELKDVALRWFFHHSQMTEGDAIVIGSSRLEQLEEVLGSLAADGLAETPLPPSVVVALNNVWQTLEGMPYYPNTPGAPMLLKL
jgi:aflatoxin B1 aldehyde reductase